MKKLSLATALITSLFAMGANAYQAEVGASFNIIDPDAGDSGNSFGLDGAYYFAPVQNKNGPLNEAAFLNRASNVNAQFQYADNDDVEVSSIAAGIEYYIPNSDFYVSGSIGRYNEEVDGVPAEDYDETYYSAEFGFFPVANLLIAAGLTGYDNDTDDDVDPTLRAKYVTQLGSYDVNLEAATSFGDIDYYALGGDVYFDNTFSIGAEYSGNNDDLSDDDLVTIRAKKFINTQFSLEGNVGFGDDYNTFGIRGAYRY